MPILDITDRWLRSVQPDPKKYVEYFDRTQKAFLVRVAPSGRKSFGVFCRAGSARERLTIGPWSRDPAPGHFSLADARKRAKELLADYRKTHSTSPSWATEPGGPRVTFGELATRYLEEHAKIQKASWDNDEYLIDRFLRPAWSELYAGDINTRMVLKLLKPLRTTPVQHNHTKCLISSIYRWGIRENLVDVNPVAGIESEKAGQTGQKGKVIRVYSEEEIRKIWAALDQMPLYEGAFYKFAFMVAQRLGDNERGNSKKVSQLTPEQKEKRTKSLDRGEILNMQWEEIDWEGGWWTIPGTRTKNSLPMRVPLMPEALELLRKVRDNQKKERELSSRFVWIMQHPGAGKVARAKREAEPDDPIRVEKQEIKPPLYMRRQYHRVRKLSGVADFTQHNVRRTVATMLTSSGVKKDDLARLLNHESRNKNSDVTSIYDLYQYDVEKQDLIAFWRLKLYMILKNQSTAGLNFRIFVTQRWAERQEAERRRAAEAGGEGQAQLPATQAAF